MSLLKQIPCLLTCVRSPKLWHSTSISTLLKQHVFLRHKTPICQFSSQTLPYDVRQRFLEYTGGSIDMEMDEQSGIAKVILNHPGKKNALSGKMIVDLVDIVDELEKWKTGKGVLLTGSAHTFCSGADLKTVHAIGDSVSGRQMCLAMQSTLNKLLRLPLLSVALVEGLALGGGAELTIACDFRIMTQAAKIGFIEVRMGVTCGWGGGTLLVNLVGRTSALELFSTGKILDSEAASKLGLINHVIDDGTDTADVAMEWLNKRCQGDVSLRRSIKSMVNYAATEYFQASLNHERELFSKFWGGPVFQEALAKNMKHKP